MTSPKRRARLFEFTREEIVAAARRTFRRVGLEGATMREIATEAGFAVGALYRYFPSKTALVNAAADEVVLEMIAACEIECAPEADYPAFFRDRFAVLFGIFLKDRMLVHAFGRARSRDGASEIGVSPAVSQAGMRIFERLIEEGMKRGAFTVTDTRTAAHMAQGAFRSAFFLYADAPEAERKRVVEGFFQFVLGGLGATPAPDAAG